MKFPIKIRVSKHANLVYEYITSYIYAYQRRCPKQDVLRTLMNAFYTYAHQKLPAYILFLKGGKR